MPVSLESQYTGYPGFWVLGEEFPTPFAGGEVLSQIQDAVSPCRFDGTQCTRSVNVFSDPGEFLHDTGRTVCVKRTAIPSCRTRMFNFGYIQRIDVLRPKLTYPQVDGHTSSTFVSGVNWSGELGISNRASVHAPTLQTYFKIGDGKYDQLMGGGRGFKNLTFVNSGFEHSFGMDRQHILYAWGSNDFGQLGLQTNEFPNGHRYKSLRPEPVAFFRPSYYYLCSGGLDALRECAGPDDTVSCLGEGAFCQAGPNQVAYRRNAFAASKQPLSPAHSAVVTEFFPKGCFEYDKFLDEFAPAQPDTACTDGGGKLFVWGYNMNGQVGVGLGEHFVLAPREVVVAGERWYCVAAGGHHTIASTTSGKLYTWGMNNAGQLGVSQRHMDTHCTGPNAIGQCCDGVCHTPQWVRGACFGTDDCLLGRIIVHVSAGHMHSVALDSMGVVWVFGHNKFGQLCQGTRVQQFGQNPVANFDNSYAPLRAHLPLDVKIVDVVAGFYHNIAVSVDGEVFVWGRNDRGQLGREHLEHDSCHLEVKTMLPYPLEVDCGLTMAPDGTGRPEKRLKSCNVVPGNTTFITAGQLHSGVVTRRKSIVRTAANKYQVTNPVASLQLSYRTTQMIGDCEGIYKDECRLQGLLFREPNRLAMVYMFGDNSFGQLGLDTKRSYVTRPETVRAFEDYDWFGLFAGGRQTFWVTAVQPCSGGCNGHGICNKDTGMCTCEYPWTYESDCLTQWCPNNCTGHGSCRPFQDVGDTGTRTPLQGTGPECVCDYPFWGVDCHRAQCPNNCWGPDHGICNNTDGTCVCVGNATVTYTGFDCYVPDPLHVFDPLRFYTQQLLRISPYFVNGTYKNLSEAELAVLDRVARYAQFQGGGSHSVPSRLALAAVAVVTLVCSWALGALGA